MFQVISFPQVFTCKKAFYQMSGKNFKVRMAVGRGQIESLNKPSQSNFTFQVIKENIFW